MDNIENKKNLKKTLEDIYNDFRLRITPKAWKNAIYTQYAEDPSQTAIQVIDFLLSHKYIPANICRTICHAISLRNNPVKIANIYSESAVESIFERMTADDPVRYAYINPDLDDNKIKEIIDTAEKAEMYIKNGQIFLAESAISLLLKACPTHPDVLDMHKRFSIIKCTGGIEINESLPEIKKNSCNEIEKLALAGKTAEAVSAYENLIENDYQAYEAYFPLGKLYLSLGEIQKADYIADIMLDFNKDPVNARILKGYVLERKNQLEDAFFYYNSACRIESDTDAADSERKRLLKDIEPGTTGLFDIKSSDNNIQNVDYMKNESRQAADTVKFTDELIIKGRLTEAYYELAKKSEEYPDSDLLKFKRAHALYLMKREPEAREVFCTVSSSSPLYRRVQNIIKDIDINIASSGRYDGVKPDVLAKIFHNTEKYTDALDVLHVMDENEMNPELYAIKGRCELQCGKLNPALKSFLAALEKDGDLQHIRELTGLIYQVKGDYERALEYYDEAIRKSENPSKVSVYKASLLYQMKRSEELTELRNLLERKGFSASDTDGYAGMAIIENDTKNTEKGIGYIERAISAGASDIRFFTAVSDYYINNGQYFKSLACIEKGLEFPENIKELALKKAQVLYLSGKLDAAYINAGILLTENPGSPAVHYLMGKINDDRGNDKEAVKWFRSAADYEPLNHLYCSALADKCFETGDMNSALVYYSKAIDINSKDYKSLKRRAVIYNMKDDDEKALEDIKQAIIINPKDPEIYIIIGDILSGYEVENILDIEENVENSDSVSEKSQEENGEKLDEVPEDKSIEDESIIENVEKDSEYYYTKAIETDPMFRQSYIRRARYYIDCHRLDEALADIDRASDFSPEESDCFMLRGIVYHIKNENEKAVENFEKAAKSGDFAIQALSYISKCCNAMGKYDDAVQAADRGLEIDSEFLNLYVNRGVALFNLEKEYQAIEDFKRVIQKKNEINTAAVEAAYRFRGLANEKLGNTEAAVSDFRMLLKYNPDHPDIRVKLEEMEGRMNSSQKKHRFSLFRKKER